MPRPLNKNVYRLGLLSLFNDVTGDIITPLLPVYLATMGMGAAFLGIMEGLANFLSYLTMLFAGFFVDRHGKNKKVTILGYSLCSFIRPFMAIPFPLVTFCVRIIDRIGKGIRTAPRDSLLTTFTEKKDWGRAFGVQRSMDYMGTLIGASLATWALWQFKLNLSYLFILGSIPAILSVLIIPRKIPEVPKKVSAPSVRFSWKDLPPSLRPYVSVIFFVALTTPSELFLLLRMQTLGLPNFLMPAAWIFLNIFSLFATYLGGHLADRWSRRATMSLGRLLLALVFAGFAFNQSLIVSWIFLACYGIQAGLVEAAERTYPIHLTDHKIRGTALGWYYFAYGIGLLPASFIFGILWNKWNPQGAFLIYGILAFACVFLVRLLPTSRSPKAPLHPVHRAGITSD